ncbi:MAG: energy transducer TonB, partial [bacterium]|nr:energy transducer TonB [bacterium]
LVPVCIIAYVQLRKRAEEQGDPDLPPWALADVKTPGEEPKKEEAKKAPEKPAEVKKEEAKAPPEPEYSEKDITSAIAGLKKKVTAKRVAEQKAIAARGRVTSRLMEIKYKVYYNTIWGIIRDAWAVPEGLKVRADLETIIGIRIAKDGRIITIEVEKSSGNSAYDDSTIRAIEKSSPLPPFPGDEPELEVGFRFTPEDSQP